MRPYVEGETLEGVSISEPDKENGSPRVGDMIAINANDPCDKWLVSEKFFQDNYEEVDVPQCCAPEPKSITG